MASPQNFLFPFNDSSGNAALNQLLFRVAPVFRTVVENLPL